MLINPIHSFSGPLAVLAAFFAATSICSADRVDIPLGNLTHRVLYHIPETNDSHHEGFLEIRITGATWTTQGDIQFVEPFHHVVSDIIRFTNINGVATIFFLSSDPEHVNTSLLPGFAPGPIFPTRTYTESTAINPPLIDLGDFATTTGVPIRVNALSDFSSPPSDILSLQANAPRRTHVP